ncbi:hypothetical protein L1994_05830 [Methanomicrobium antiquum]|uniref:Uncharacterized protein n=1 Tax=Methanomicrobium antiquum TaxID=487686 RepID=A0AAF0JNZ7_9EURY|nr:hypothetical protein [Methanomicrobium antiquum]WFN37901.1 hypothetical protein L1994_05830 [Methanomicrobium antiquum]
MSNTSILPDDNIYSSHFSVSKIKNSLSPGLTKNGTLIPHRSPFPADDT